ncbi:MAG: alpha/beta hydrolase [Deltaproteobacteria bacterium]|nr:alpha/beta hydrolase [Deltaproteobacteria bacterium]
MNSQIQQKYFKTFDGHKIGYQVMGKGKKPFVLCNGLGGSAIAWKPIVDQFQNEYRFITWDYCGLFSSETKDTPDDLRIERHVKDMEALLKHEGIKKAVFGAWSMGVQVCLDYYRDHSEQYQGMVLFNGAAGEPYNTVLNSKLSKFVLPVLNQQIIRLMPIMQPRLQPLAELVVDHKEFIRIIKRLKIVHQNLDTEIFRQVALSMMKTNLTVYHHILECLSLHDASDVLPHIEIPTLVMAGSRDVLTPQKVAESMVEQIPHAELLVLPQGSHYMLLEFPEWINKRLDQFLNEHQLIGKRKKSQKT